MITPDMFAGKDIQEIENLTVYYGNKTAPLKDFFKVEGGRGETPGEIRIIINGDASKTKRIGQEMTAGEIVVKGSVDMYAGRLIKGGKLLIEGNADSFCGQLMEGGEIIIKGNAGDYLGASYRGEWRGMKGGSIIAEGDVGMETGVFMMGGRIHIKGRCDALPGIHMSGGLIVIDGETVRAGGQMTGGSIILNNPSHQLLPGFDKVEELENPEVSGEKFQGHYVKYSGDHAEKFTKGELFVKKQ